MGFSDFWVQNSKGSKEQLGEFKHGIRKDQLDKKYQALFSYYDLNNDGTLEEEELTDLFNHFSMIAGDDKVLSQAENKAINTFYSKIFNPTDENSKEGEVNNDIDFGEFVRAVNSANDDIYSSSTKKGEDGGNIIETVYRDGLIETIHYYPNGEFKYKTQKKHAIDEQVNYTYIDDDGNSKTCSQEELDKMIDEGYKRKRAQERGYESTGRTLEAGYRASFMQSHSVIPEVTRNEINIDNTELSTRAKKEAILMNFIASHFIESQNDCKAVLDSMGAFDDAGMVINEKLQSLYTDVKNFYNAAFGNGEKEDYEHLLSLVTKFMSNYIEAKNNQVKLDKMQEAPETFFSNFSTVYDKDCNFEKFEQFMITTEKYQNATALKQRLALLDKALERLNDCKTNDLLAKQAGSGAGQAVDVQALPDVENYLRQFFNNDEEALNLTMFGKDNRFNTDRTIEEVKKLKEDTEKCYRTLLIDETQEQEYDYETVGNTSRQIARPRKMKSYEDLKSEYYQQYQEIYGKEPVQEELMERALEGKATGSMVKLGTLTLISMLITKSPAISSAVGGAEGAVFLRTLVSKYGQTAVQQGIKFAMTSGTLALDTGLTLLNQLTSVRGVDGEELLESSLGSAKYIFLGAYVGSPLAQMVSSRVAQIGLSSEKLMLGGKTVTQGAVRTSTISGEAFLQNVTKQGASGALSKCRQIASGLSGLATEAGVFTFADAGETDGNLADAFGEQSEMLTKMKVMNHVLEYLLGGQIHTATTGKTSNNALNDPRVKTAIEKSGVSKWNIKSIETPNKPTIYEVEIEKGKPPLRFSSMDEVNTFMLEIVAKSYAMLETNKTQDTEAILAEPEKEIHIPAGSCACDNAKFAETDEAFRSIVTKRATDIKELDKITDIDEFCRKSFALIKEEMGLEDSDVKLEITDSDNYYDQETNTVYISRNWAGTEKKNLKGKGDKAEIFGGIAHELNHYLQWKEVILNLDSENSDWNKIISYLQNFESAEKNIEYILDKYPDNTEQKEAFEKAKIYQDNWLHYVDAFDKNGKLKTGEEYEKYKNQPVEAESFRRGNIVAEAYRNVTKEPATESGKQTSTTKSNTPETPQGIETETNVTAKSKAPETPQEPTVIIAEADVTANSNTPMTHFKSIYDLDIEKLKNIKSIEHETVEIFGKIYNIVECGITDDGHNYILTDTRIKITLDEFNRPLEAQTSNNVTKYKYPSENAKNPSESQTFDSYSHIVSETYEHDDSTIEYNYLIGFMSTTDKKNGSTTGRDLDQFEYPTNITSNSHFYTNVRTEIVNCKTIEEVNAVQNKYASKGYQISDTYFNDKRDAIITADVTHSRTLKELENTKKKYADKGIPINDTLYNNQINSILDKEITSCKTFDELDSFINNYRQKGVNVPDEFITKQQNEIAKHELQNCKTIEELNALKNSYSQRNINISDDTYNHQLYNIILTEIKSCTTTDALKTLQNKYSALGINIPDKVFEYYSNKNTNDTLSDTEIAIRKGNASSTDRFQRRELNLNDSKYENNLPQVCRELQTHLEKDMGVLTETQIDDMVQSISQKLDVPKEEVLEVMFRLTQFGSIKSLESMSTELDKYEISGFYEKCGISTNSALNYFVTKKQIKFDNHSNKKAFILDDAGLKYLEKLDKNDLDDFYKNVVAGQIVLVELDGTGLKIGDNYYSYTMLDGGQSLSAMTEAVLKQVQSGKTLDNVLQGDYRQRLNNVFKSTGCDEHFAESFVKTISIKESATTENIAAQTRPNMPDADYIQQVISTVIEKSAGLTDSEKPIASSVIAKYFDYMTKEYSSDSFGELLKTKHDEIEQKVLELGKTMDDVVYIYPKSGKSFDLVYLQYAKINGIDPSKIIEYSGNTGNPNLDGKVVVLLDDVVGSGHSMIDQAFDYRTFSMNHNNSNVIFAPITCADNGRAYITKYINEFSRQDKDFIITDSSQSISYNDFIKMISAEEYRVLEKVIGVKGYEKSALVTGFQYMTPDNDSSLGGYLNLINLNNPMDRDANKTLLVFDYIADSLHKYLQNRNPKTKEEIYSIIEPENL